MKILGINLGGKAVKTQELKMLPPPENTVVKSSGSGYVNYLFNSFGMNIGDAFLAPITAYRFFNKISPLQGAVTKVTSALSELPLVLRESKDPEQLIKEHPVLDLLNNPSTEMTKKQFLDQSATSLMLTRELWIVARGLVSQMPLELSFIHAYNIQIIEDPLSTWPVKIYTNINGDRRYYERTVIKNRFRYFDDTGLNEIYPYIVERSVSGTGGYFRGISPLSSLKDELLSYSASILGNTASIENSGRPSGIISPKNDNLGDTQWDDLQDSLDEVSGAANSGKILLLPASVEAAFQQWAPKDMDYKELQENVKHNIWNLYSIPLPIVASSTQTFSNFSESQTAFYDESVNEIWGALADALKWILSTRVDLKGLDISYNQFEVPALKRRAIQQMKNMKESEAVSINEIRSSAGYEDVEDGEEILIPSNKTTLGAIVEGPSFAAAAASLGTTQPSQSGKRPTAGRPEGA